MTPNPMPPSTLSNWDSLQEAYLIVTKWFTVKKEIWGFYSEYDTQDIASGENRVRLIPLEPILTDTDSYQFWNF